MKILFYTDLHFRYNWDFFKISKNGHSNLLDHLTDTLKWVESQIEEHKPDLVVCGGDIYHQMNSLDSHTITVSVSALKHLYDVCNSVKSQHNILLGNHDFISEKRDISIIDYIDSFPDTRVIKNLEKLDNLIFCPYYFSKENLSLSQDILENKNSIFFGHLSLQGGYYKNFKRKNLLLEELEHQSLTTQVKSFRLVFNGHHHIPQRLSDNVILPGSLIQIDLDEAEVNLPRGIWLIDSETFNIQLLQNKISPKLHRVYSKEELQKLPDNSYVYYGYQTPEELKEVGGELKRFLGQKTEKLITTRKEKSKKVIEFSSLTNLQLLEHYTSQIEVKSDINLLLKYGAGCLNEATSSTHS